MPDTIEYSLDKARIIIASVHDLLRAAHWSTGIPLETVEISVKNSSCAGAYNADGNLVGFARLVTDGATFAYLCDVVVDPAVRGRGIGKKLVGMLLEQDFVAGLRRILLATRDAHGLYSRYGFEALAAPATFMEILRPSVYDPPLI